MLIAYNKYMFDFISSRLQKSLAKMKAKTTLSEADILEVTREIKMALLEADVNLVVVKEFVNSIKEKAIGAEIIGQLNKAQQVIKIVNDELIKILGQNNFQFAIKGKPEVIMMTGLQGSGKTTTSAKLVKHLIKKHGITKPLMVAADIYRPAAVEQLKTLGKELQIDVFSMSLSTNPRVIATEGVKKAKEEGYDLVIIDTAGRLAIDEELMQELYDIKKLINPHETIFVADAMSGQDVINVARAFNDKLRIDGTIITKLDSDARGGAALSITSLLNVPIMFVGTGEKANALEIFYPTRMANRILGMGDVLSLIEKAEESFDEASSKKMMNRLLHGHFDMNDLINQLSQMKKMGKMSKVLKMLPGMADKIDETKLDSAENKLALYEIMISSMTKKERKNPKLLKETSRKTRIMRGSGRSAQEYNQLINDFDRMKKQVTEMAKSMKSGNFNPGMFGKMGIK